MNTTCSRRSPCLLLKVLCDSDLLYFTAPKVLVTMSFYLSFNEEFYFQFSSVLSSVFYESHLPNISSFKLIYISCRGK